LCQALGLRPGANPAEYYLENIVRKFIEAGLLQADDPEDLGHTKIGVTEQLSRLRQTAFCLLTALFVGFVKIGAPVNYYDSAIGQTGAALKSTLHDIIDGHTVLPYTSGGIDTYLRQCVVSVNSSRGNKFYDETTPPGSSYPDAPLSNYDADSWEPRTEEKGLIARSMFYMAVRYDGTDPDVPDLELSDFPSAAQYRFGKLTTLLDWHRQFPCRCRARPQPNHLHHLRAQPHWHHECARDLAAGKLKASRAWTAREDVPLREARK